MYPWLFTLIISGAALAAPEIFYNEYSRPNDDTFQNATGNAGEPYEVARIRSVLVAEKTDTGIRLRYEWSATMVTGRHVESGLSFALTSSENSVSSETLAPQRLQAKYPEGADARSFPDKKKGARLEAAMELGTIAKDGEYTGTLLVKKSEATGPGIRHFSDRGPTDGVFQTLPWKILVKEGKIEQVELKCARAKLPAVRLVLSNFKKINTSLPEHQPYPPQPAAAACAEEKVGDGTSVSTEDTPAQKLGRNIVKAGCLDCHDRGSKSNALFCDDGTALTPTTTYPIIRLFIESLEVVEEKNPDGQLRYPKGMVDSLRLLQTQLEEGGKEGLGWLNAVSARK